MHKLGQKHLKEAEELNITAFMNLMVILVPFLLITAVFSRMTVLDLNLPVLNKAQKNNKKVKLSLELVLRNNGFDIEDANLGLIKHIDRTPGTTQWNQFSNILLELKRRFPNDNSITLLVGPNVDYKTLIKTMDHVSSTDLVVGTSLTHVELFPNISIGNAPQKSVNQDAVKDTQKKNAGR